MGTKHLPWLRDSCVRLLYKFRLVNWDSMRVDFNTVIRNVECTVCTFWCVWSMEFPLSSSVRRWRKMQRCWRYERFCLRNNIPIIKKVSNNRVVHRHVLLLWRGADYFSHSFARVFYTVLWFSTNVHSFLWFHQSHYHSLFTIVLSSTNSHRVLTHEEHHFYL